MNATSDMIRILQESGQGRATVLLHESKEFAAYAEMLTTKLSQRSRVVHLEVDNITTSNWISITQHLQTILTEKQVRSACFIGMGSAGTIIQHLALKELKLFRTMVLVDAATRPHPTAITKIVDRLESILPLGLPLRSSFSGFDGKPFLQRIRCPVLVVNTPSASPYLRSQATIFTDALPTAWLLQLEQGETPQHTTEQLARHIFEFQDVPAKCPQKNMGKNNSTSIQAL